MKRTNNEPFLTITTSQISEKVAADTLRITEILYKHHTHWRIRDATNVYHSLGGVYVQFGNMPARQRKLLKNHFVLGIRTRKLMEVNGQDAWVIAGLGVVTADLPQGNDMCGVLRHNANKGCRTCTASRESLTNFSQDVPATSRYHHITDDQFKEIFDEPATTRQRRLYVYHATAGKIGRLLKLTANYFHKKERTSLSKPGRT
ncbi:hypothetical protein GLOIN_2v1776429 [Rhizophagus irregularis DAOM 181602=DAOM 197198]|nr:hypothetical protein GLOIN_2v1776429 [Rhizophagus irregularis DAOM 181602=DAOM 197198]